MEVKVISREMVKPSKPTSPENKIFKLCSFDILFRNTYFPVFLFYPTFKNPNNILKHSLSETLAIFYPIAGRRKDLFTVACNDEGALYYEATVNASISDVLDPLKHEALNQLVPCEPKGEGGTLPHLLVQVNTFECGGVAIVVSILHTIMDANSLNVLLTTWSAICRNQREEIAWPDYESAFALFPPRDFSRVRAGMVSSPGKIDTICILKRFVFTEEAINKLKTKVKEEEEEEEGKGDSSMKPTSYQVLSSFMSKHMMLTYASKGTRSLVLLMHIMDVRRRRGHPLTANTMGNVLWPAIVPYDKLRHADDDVKISVHELAKTARRKIGSFGKEFFLRVEKDARFLESDECADMLMEGIVEKEKPLVIVFSSWGHLGFNEMDFGWGKPLWYGVRGGIQETVPNSVRMIYTNQGIEAWIALPEEYMAVLERDEEFLSYVLLNPPIPC